MKVFFGPNAFAEGPVVVGRLPPTAELPGDPLRAMGRLEAAFPGWLADAPALDSRSTFEGGAWLAAELARGLLNSCNGCIVTAGARTEPDGHAALWVGYHVPSLAAEALTLAIQLVTAAGTPASMPHALLRQVATLQQQCRRQHPDYLARILLIGARALDLPASEALIGLRHWQFGWGSRARVFRESAPAHESVLAHHLAANKVLTHDVLRRLGFPSTEQRLANDADEARAHAAELGWPVVVKPADRGKGKGVTVDIRHETALRTAFDEAKGLTRSTVIVERFVAGFDHRLLVVRGRLIAATRREPPSVVGDGRSTLRSLMTALNSHRAGEPVLARYLKPVTDEPAVLRHVAQQGLDLDAVPETGRRVALRGNANVSTGGTPTNVLPRIHPQVRAMAEAIAANIGLECIGIDYITPDISRSWREVPGAVIEVNRAPGLDLHLADGGFDEAALGSAMLGPTAGRIPLAVLVASPACLRASIAALRAQGPTLQQGVALLGPDSLRIGEIAWDDAALPLPARVRRLLGDPQVASALLAVSCADIAEHGFPVDRCALALCGDSEPAATAALVKRCAERVMVVPSAAPNDSLIASAAAFLSGTGP